MNDTKKDKEGMAAQITEGDQDLKPGSIVVHLQNNSYAPQSLIIGKGIEVTFINDDDEQHSVTSSSDGFDLELAPGELGKARFDISGTFDYYCRYHPSMRGVVTVKD